MNVYINGVRTAGLQVRSIRSSYVRSWQAELYWPGRHDDPPDVALNDEVRIEGGGPPAATVFWGNVTAVRPGGVAQEGVVYVASDKRFRLENEPVRINDRGFYLWNRRGYSGSEGEGGEDSPGQDGGKWTAGEIVLDILEHALGLPAGGSDIAGHHGDDCCVRHAYLTDDDVAGYDADDILALDSVVGEFAVNNTSVADAISLLLGLNGGFYGWYIGPATGSLEVVDLDALPAADLQAGRLGRWRDEAGADYVLLGNALEWSLDGVCTTIIIQGTDRTEEEQPNNIEGSGNPGQGDRGELELVAAPWRGFPAAYRPKCQPRRNAAGKSIDEADLYTPPAGWSGFSFSPRVYRGTGAGAKTAYSPSSRIFPKWFLTPGIIGFYEAPPLGGGEKLWGWYWAHMPFTVQVGPQGDAYHWYGYERTRTIYDAAFRHPSSWPQPGPAEDQAAMQTLAGRLLRLFRDVRRQGTLLCDGVDFAKFGLGKRYNLHNLGPAYLAGPGALTTAPQATTTQAGGFSDPMAWGSLAISAVDVLYDFERDATEITVANTFWMLEEYSELKRRLMINLFAGTEAGLSENLYDSQLRPSQVQDPGEENEPEENGATTQAGTTPPGGTTTQGAGSTTTAAAPTTTTPGGPGVTTTDAPGCPEPSYCYSNCPYELRADWPAGGTTVWTNTGTSCLWYWASGTPMGPILCSTGWWLMYNSTGQIIYYRKPATEHSCPTGTYSRLGAPPELPDEVTVYA